MSTRDMERDLKAMLMSKSRHDGKNSSPNVGLGRDLVSQPTFYSSYHVVLPNLVRCMVDAYIVSL